VQCEDLILVTLWRVGLTPVILGNSILFVTDQGQKFLEANDLEGVKFEKSKSVERDECRKDTDGHGPARTDADGRCKVGRMLFFAFLGEQSDRSRCGGPAKAKRKAIPYNAAGPRSHSIRH
jgi:hypothetical protein